MSAFRQDPENDDFEDQTERDADSLSLLSSNTLSNQKKIKNITWTQKREADAKRRKAVSDEALLMKRQHSSSSASLKKKESLQNFVLFSFTTDSDSNE